MFKTKLRLIKDKKSFYFHIPNEVSQILMQGDYILVDIEGAIPFLKQLKTPQIYLKKATCKKLFLLHIPKTISNVFKFKNHQEVNIEVKVYKRTKGWAK